MFNKFFEKTLKNYVSIEWIPLLKNCTSTRKHKKNERIFNEEDEVKGIFFINDGMVKVVSHYDATNERILRLPVAEISSGIEQYRQKDTPYLPLP